MLRELIKAVPVPGNSTIVQMVFGSHLYGTNTPESDYDLKGVAWPTPRDILVGSYPPNIITTSTGQENAKNMKGDLDVEIMALNQFIKLALNGEMIAFDMLFAPEDSWIEFSDTWKKIVRYRSAFISKNAYAFISYIRKQVAKYGIKGSRLDAMEKLINLCRKHPGIRLGELVDEFPENDHTKIIEPGEEGNPIKESQPQITLLYCCGKKYHYTAKTDTVLQSVKKNYNTYGARALQAKVNMGIDWKAVSHAMRACHQMKELFLRGTMTFPRPEADTLIKIKRGESVYMEVAEELEYRLDQLELIRAGSGYPDEPDKKFWDDFLCRETYNYLEKNYGGNNG